MSAETAPRVFVLDHEDSFVFMLADEFARLGAEVRVHRCDLTLAELEAELSAFDPDLVVLSPGPGHPRDATLTLQWLATRPRVPVLGVCLGHQAMGLVEGGEVDRAPEPVHGKAAVVELADDPLFEGLPRVMRAARYHSLLITRLPPSLTAVAVTREGGRELVMAVRHRELPWIGVQFHPESYLTPGGAPLLDRVLAYARAVRGGVASAGTPS